jgi:hypothetical protein
MANPNEPMLVELPVIPDEGPFPLPPITNFLSDLDVDDCFPEIVDDDTIELIQVVHQNFDMLQIERKEILDLAFQLAKIQMARLHTINKINSLVEKYRLNNIPPHCKIKPSGTFKNFERLEEIVITSGKNLMRVDLEGLLAKFVDQNRMFANKFKSHFDKVKKAMLLTAVSPERLGNAINALMGKDNAEQVQIIREALYKYHPLNPKIQFFTDCFNNWIVKFTFAEDQHEVAKQEASRKKQQQLELRRQQQLEKVNALFTKNAVETLEDKINLLAIQASSKNGPRSPTAPKTSKPKTGSAKPKKSVHNQSKPKAKTKKRKNQNVKGQQKNDRK